MEKKEVCGIVLALLVFSMAVSLAEENKECLAYSSPYGGLSISVTDSHFNSISGATVVSTSVPYGQSALTGTTDDEGYATWHDILPGPYSFVINKDGYQPGGTTVTVEENVHKIVHAFLTPLKTGSIAINDGAAYTNTTSVLLALSATDLTYGIAEMRFSNDGLAWSEWETYATSKTWVLTTGDGTKEVTVQYKNNAGLVSSYSDSIILDATKPTAEAGQDQKVNVGTTASFDAGASSDNFGIISYEWDFGDGTGGIGNTTTHTYTKPSTYTVTLTVKDAAGNTATDTMTITAVSTGALPVLIVGGAIVAIAIAVAAILFWKKRKQIQ
jgi:hypothetical protein